MGTWWDGDAAGRGRSWTGTRLDGDAAERGRGRTGTRPNGDAAGLGFGCMLCYIFIADDAVKYAAK